jgi:hypothetical protein
MPDAMTTKMEHLTDDERRIHALYAYLGKQHLQGFTGQDVDYLLTTIAALRAFKGVSTDPDSPHKAEGCRIGGRLDELIGERDTLRERVAGLEKAMATVMKERDDAAQSALHCLGGCPICYTGRLSPLGYDPDNLVVFECGGCGVQFKGSVTRRKYLEMGAALAAQPPTGGT